MTQMHRYSARLCKLAIEGDVGNAERIIVENSIDVNLRTPCGVRLITLALKLHSTSFTKMLLAHGADVNQIEDEPDPESEFPGMSVLERARLAAETIDDFSALSQLLDCGLNVDTLDSHKRTMLMHSVCNSAAVTRWLLNRGADPNHRAPDGRTALMFAAAVDVSTLKESEIMQVVQDLVGHGADLNAMDENGQRACDVLEHQQCFNIDKQSLLRVMRITSS
jgi:ankyrin repeat protein